MSKHNQPNMDKTEISPYRSMLFNISRELSDNDVEQLTYLCKDHLTENEREAIKNARKLFDALEKKGLISPDDLKFLIKILGDLGRDDLRKKLLELLQSREKSLSPTSLQMIDTSPENAAGYRDSGSFSLSPHQRQSLINSHPKTGVLKTPADFSPNNMLQTRPVGTPPSILSCNRLEGGKDTSDAASKTVASNPNQSPSTTGMKRARISDIPILDWPNDLTPLSSETLPDGESPGSPGVKSLSEGKETGSSNLLVSRGEMAASEVKGHFLSTCKSILNDQSGAEAEASFTSPSCSDKKLLSKQLFDGSIGDVETDAPQVPRVAADDTSLTEASWKNPASLLSQEVDNPSSEAVSMEALVDTLNQGAHISGSNDDNAKSQEYNGTATGEDTSASEMHGNVSLRDYQHELAHYPLSTGGNYIICAPTGSGKTLTAASICYKNYVKFQANAAASGKHFKALFIVNIRHLTQQQKNAFQEYFPNKLAIRNIAEQQPFEYALMKDEAMPVVLMLTAQILVNALRQKTVTLQDLDMLIFDECHHTDLLHPYNVIMKTYLKQKEAKSQGIGEHVGCLPQVIGLSASLGVGRGQQPLSHILKLCANMDVRDVIRVRKHKKQLDEFVKAPEQDAIISVLPRVTTKRHFGGLLDVIMGEIEDQLGETTKNSLPRHGCQPYENEVISRQEASSRHEDIVVYKYLNAYNRALMLYEDLPVQDCLDTLEEFHASRSFSQNQEDTTEERLCRHLFDANLDEMKRMAIEGGDSNPKLQELIKLLAAQFAKSPQSKGIVLTRMKVATVALCQFIRSSQVLKQLPCRVKPERLVGQGALDEYCMTESEQKMILENFRQEDGCNILVATDIAQEGLDMPACNFVIRYNFVSNEIGTVQSKGRARAEGSQCSLIVGSGSPNEVRELENRGKVKSMEEAMNDLEAMNEDERLNGIKEKQDELIAAMQEAERLEQQRIARIKETQITLLCGECNQPVCTSSDLRRKGAGGHVTCIDPDFEEKVTDRILEAPATRYRDTQSVCKIMCGNPVCKNQLGTRETFYLQSTSDGFSLRAKSFITQYPQGGKKKLKKWKELTIIEDENL